MAAKRPLPCGGGVWGGGNNFSNGLLVHKNESGVKKVLETVFQEMTCQEWLDQSQYTDDNGEQKYEILDIMRTFLMVCG